MALPSWMSGNGTPYSNADTLTSVGLGLLSGKTAQDQVANAAMNFANERQMGRMVNKTVAFLEKQYPDLAEAVKAGNLSAGDAWKMAYQHKLEAEKPKSPLEVNGRLIDPSTYQVLADFSDPPKGPQPTDDMREYEYAKSQGFTGSFTDYQTSLRKAGATNVNTGVQLPAEMGARIGLGDQFLTELPQIKSDVKSGAIDSVIERGQLAAGVGTPAEIWRRIETGKEALVRNLTGAGMAQAEAENVAKRYQISPTDSIDTQIKKLEGLERDLEATKAGAIGARTGQLSTGPAQAQPPGGVVDYSDYFKQ
ncbi:hypothetical protein [Sinorhizobium meliloti]|uniref:hypothetical protein n=1 Tax=Rhizobium meliloti TaxID=382 RepID=UPI001294D4BF|nr:hypothetical protein [Sinorhizobium meliloti]MQU85697.1 hypothetical protein [Sinorhizobium meliloti]